MPKVSGKNLLQEESLVVSGKSFAKGTAEIIDFSRDPKARIFWAHPLRSFLGKKIKVLFSDIRREKGIDCRIVTLILPEMCAKKAFIIPEGYLRVA